MNENWQRIESLFLQALDLPADERTSFLDSACAGNAEVRREVESLLAHDHTGEQDIEQALQQTAQSLFEFEDLAGTRLGAWRVLHEIGRGGMGSVYLAVRDDKQFQKRVAIKVVKRGMDTAELLERLRRERQILAQLDHPYIARLIDGGSTAQGRPYLVMEYVEGRRIDAYCREEGLDTEARCRLFLKVCEAVSYAHRNLVIHRDLKPGNILVTSDGSPKLLDFGVAKLLDPEIASDAQHTVAAGRLLTPEYASPEQVRGELVGTASDIYALGAILYKMLTGVKAQHVESHSPAELERVICNTEVQLPSVAVEPENTRLRKRLAGDLDNIVLMAMRKEPERRYSSVDLFADDISRHLEGRTVMARRPSLQYRVGKFARRNRLWLAAAALVLVSLVGGTWAALTEARRARFEQHRAEARLSEMVELANRALFDVHGSIERLPGATDARRQLVNTTLNYLQKLSSDAGNDERLRKALGAAYYRLGDLQGYPFAPNLGDTAGALKSYRTSAALLDPLRRAHPDDAEAQRLWLQTQNRLGTLLNQTGDSSGAAALLRAALPSAERLGALPTAGPEEKRVPGDLYGQLAAILPDREPAEAQAYARRYLDTYSALATAYPDRADFVLEEATAYEQLGHLLHLQGDSRGALEIYRQCVALQEKLVHAHPNDVLYKRNLMLGYGHVGDMLGSPIAQNLGDSEGALAYYRKAVAIAEEIHTADPLDSNAKFDLAAALERLGMVDVPASGVPESLAALQRSADLLQSMDAQDPRNVRVKRMLALTLEYQGHRLQSLSRYPEAIVSYRRSVALSDEMLAVNPTDTSALSQAVASERGIAAALAMAGRRAEALHQAQVTIARAEAGTNAPNNKRPRRRYVAESIIEEGSVYVILASQSRQVQDWQAARSALQQAVAMLEQMAAEGKPSGMEQADMQRARKLLTEADAHPAHGEPKLQYVVGDKSSARPR